MEIDSAALDSFVSSNAWKTRFSSTVLAEGRKMARAKQLTGCKAELLDTGDMEIVSTVMDSSGIQHESIIVLWVEGNSLAVDTDCSCSVSSWCVHSAAAFEHLSRPGRIENALGELAGDISAKVIEEPAALDENGNVL